MTTRQLSRLLRKSHKITHSWAQTGREYGITGGMAFRIAKQSYDPINEMIREKLGLPPLPCRKCHRPLPHKHVAFVNVEKPVEDEPVRRVLSGAWKSEAGWVRPEEAFGERS